MQTLPVQDIGLYTKDIRCSHAQNPLKPAAAGDQELRRTSTVWEVLLPCLEIKQKRAVVQTMVHLQSQLWILAITFHVSLLQVVY